MNQKFKPLLDKLFFIIWISILAILTGATVISSFAPISLAVTIPIDIFTLYFLFSSLFGYAELREDTLFIKFGFIIKREIPYNKIRTAEKKRCFYSESMLALKNSFEHVDIKYNRFDVVSVSVVGNDEFIEELYMRIDSKKI